MVSTASKPFSLAMSRYVSTCGRELRGAGLDLHQGSPRPPLPWSSGPSRRAGRCGRRRPLKGTSMKVWSWPDGAPRGFTSPRPNSRTAPITASRAEVARRSASSGPLIPLVGISRAGCQWSTAMGVSPCRPVVRRRARRTSSRAAQACPIRRADAPGRRPGLVPFAPDAERHSSSLTAVRQGRHCLNAEPALQSCPIFTARPP